MSNFKVTKLIATNPMLKTKGTNFLSEISAFFKNNDASKAMNSMMDMILFVRKQD